jgi:hypothetical protein
MRIGSSLAFIGIGAILAFAVTSNTPVFNIHTAGWVLMLVGVIGIFLPRSTADRLSRRLLVRRTYPGGRVEHVPVPPYVARNPGASAIAAGPPFRPTLAEQGNRDLIDEADYDPASYSAPPDTVPIRDTPPDGMPATGYRDGYTPGSTTGRPPVPSVTEVVEDLYEEP